MSHYVFLNFSIYSPHRNNSQTHFVDSNNIFHDMYQFSGLGWIVSRPGPLVGSFEHDY